ncbi:MAG: PD40 domain-containing protein [Gemmatimonadaceae bacterium]|nr:PD40 domain-containing protein [Gemmatimonadaceae bacterium]
MSRLVALLSVVASTAVSVPGVWAQAPAPIRFARFPHVANDGRLAFTYADDIWISDANGANPRRLTAHVARDIAPRFSPDGQWIAFTSNRNGNNDVYVVGAAGGEPRQLTWFSGDDQALYFAPDGQSIIMTSTRGPNPWGSPLYRLPLDGTIPMPLGMDIGRSGMMKQDATAVAFNRVLPTYWRKGYRGNNSGDIAVQDVRTGEIREITDTDLQQYKGHVNDVHPMWGADGMIYFASERDGTLNIWRTSAAGGAAQQVTRHRNDGVQFPSMSPDGRHLVYENEFELWTLDVPGGTPRKVPITLAFDPKENDAQVVTSDSRAEGFAVSPDAGALAVDYHGEIVIVPVEAGVGERLQLSNSPWRERFQVYSPDGRRLAYVSDESGEEEVWVIEVATMQRRKLTTHESVKADLTWAPNSQKLAYTASNRLFEVDVSGASAAREVASNPAGGFANVQYASDGSWMIYVRRDDDQNAEVFALDVAAKREYNLTQSPFNETSAQLSADGRTIVFTSNRDGGTTQLFAASLARLTEDPNDPLVRERLRRASARPDSAPGAGALRIDAVGIDRRAVQLTRGTSAVGVFFLSRDGRTVFFSQGTGGGPGGGAPAAGDNPDAGLYAVNIDGRERRRIAQGTFTGMVPSMDRRTVFFRSTPRAGGDDGAAEPGFEIHKLVVAAPQRTERVNFTFPVRVDRRAEWNQLFEESWRVMKYRFYDEKMHGYDWDAIRTRYRPLLAHVGTNEDLYDLTNEMIGELNASHTGVSGPPTRPMPAIYRTRFPGFEVEPANGRYRVTHIYKDGPADREWIDLSVGDYVLAIDGQELKAGDNYWKLLSTTANDYVPVRYAKTPDGAGARTVRVATVTSLTDIRYEEWVARNRDEVTRATNGDIAYVHIRAMNQPSLARFRNEIDQFSNAKGIIVDIRFNGGGNIDQELIDILERRPYQFWNNRSGSRVWGRRPRQAIAGPKVMLINHRSGSDSEVTPMGFRQLGLGRIVGNPTAAAVIATGSYALINGGAIRTPGSLVITWDPSKPNNYGVNLENLGVPPDVWVENSPMDEVKKVDRELRTAIDEALRMLRASPPRVSSDQ